MLNIVSIYAETLLLVIMITCYQVFVFVLDSLSANQTSPRDVYAWGGSPIHYLYGVCATQWGHDFEAPDLERGIHSRSVF